jgi:hypothetical protein
MAYISTLDSKGAGLAKQNRFYDDWSSGNSAVNNALLYRARVKSENRRLKLTVRDSVANALLQSTERLSPPEPSYRSVSSATARTTGRSVLGTSARARLEDEEEEEEANRLAQQMLDAQRELELQRVIGEEQESTKELEEKFEKITAFLKAQQAEEARRRRAEEKASGRQESFERPVRFSERKKQAYKIMVADPLHGRTRLVTARLSGSDQLITERGIQRQKEFLKKQQNLPRVLPRRTIAADAVTMSQNPKIQYEQKKW